MIYARGNPEFVDGKAVICYDDLAQRSGAVLSASSTAAASGTTTYDAANAFDGLTYDYWQPAAGGQQYLKVALTASQPVDYMALAAHDLGSRACVVQLQGSIDDSTYVNLLPEGTFTPTDDDPIVRLFQEKAYRYFKLLLTPGNGTEKVGIFMLGRSTPLQRGIHTGHRPAPFSRNVEFSTNQAESGQFLGRSILRVSNDTDIALSKITGRWYRETLEPMIRAAETRPFAFVWDRWRRPDEAFFGYLTDRSKPVNEQGQFMAVTLPCRGIA